MNTAVYNDMSSLTRLKAQSAEKPEEVLDEAAKQFESLFVSMVLKAMRDTVPEDSLFGSSSMQTYQEMFDQQLSLDLSRKNGIGLSEIIAKQLSGAPKLREPEPSGEGIALPVKTGDVKQKAAVTAYTTAATDPAERSVLQGK